MQVGIVSTTRSVDATHLLSCKSLGNKGGAFWARPSLGCPFLPCSRLYLYEPRGRAYYLWVLKFYLVRVNKVRILYGRFRRGLCMYFWY